MGLRIALLHRLGLLRRPLIVPFRGFGNTHRVEISGRVTENNNLLRISRRNSILANMLATAKRYLAVPIPDVAIKVTFLDQEVEVVTNTNGIFHARIDIQGVAHITEGWYPVRCDTCVSRYIPEHVCVSTESLVYIDKSTSQFGVISDIDDTILISRATNIIKTVITLAINNARSRLPFRGVANLYQALHRGSSGTSTNPFFYISSGQWSLYDFLIEFLDRHNFPKGVVLLKETYGLLNIFTTRKDHRHKIEKITSVLETVSEIPFVLLGDTGQSDPEIYAAIAEKFPDRIAVIYIRDVTKGRDVNVSHALYTLKKVPVPLVVVRTTEEIFEHAEAHGYIKKRPHSVTTSA